MPEEEPAEGRKIIHVDMDAFFASVEQRDDPRLRGSPVAVGGSARRGVVAAASYEARRFGVRSAMPSVTAARLCPDLIFVKPRFDVYRNVSLQIRRIFRRYTDLVEPLSLDEAYLDVTHDKRGVGSAVRIARLIRSQIRSETGLTASAGVSYNKFLAKIASDQNKPDGIHVILPDEGEAFVASLPVRRFYGVGPKTAQRMEVLGILTGADLRECSMDFLVEHFGKSAGYLYWAARGVDDRPVRPDRIRKSVGGERTFSDDLHSEAELREALERIVDLVWERIEAHGVSGRTVTLKVRYADFRLVTRRRTCDHDLAGKAQFAAIACDLLGQLLPPRRGVRLLGVTLSGLADLQSRPAAPEEGAHLTEQRAFDF
jgi:DNA polymerase-4